MKASRVWVAPLMLLATCFASPVQSVETTRPSAADPIDVELRRLCDMVVRGVRQLPGDASYRRVAVLPFRGAERDQNSRWVRRMVTDYLGAYCLPVTHGVVVVEPDPALSAETDLATRRQLAREMGISTLVDGQISRGNRDYTISTRVYDTETEQQGLSMIRLLPLREANVYASARLEGRAPANAALRSLALPGWGQFYNGDTVKGAVFVTAEVLLLSTALGFAVAENYQWQRRDQHLPDTVDAHDAALAHRQRALIALGIAGGVWAASVLDAYLSGYRYVPEDAFRTRLQVRPTVGPGGVSLQGWW